MAAEENAPRAELPLHRRHARAFYRSGESEVSADESMLVCGVGRSRSHGFAGVRAADSLAARRNSPGSPAAFVLCDVSAARREFVARLDGGAGARGGGSIRPSECEHRAAI